MDQSELNWSQRATQKQANEPKINSDSKKCGQIPKTEKTDANDQKNGIDNRNESSDSPKPPKILCPENNESPKKKISILQKPLFEKTEDSPEKKKNAENVTPPKETNEAQENDPKNEEAPKLKGI